MKKILLTLCMVLSLIPAAWAGNPSGKIRTLASEYRREPGFEVVDMGGLAIGLLRVAARTQAETEKNRKVLDLLKGIKHLTVLEFAGADATRKDQFLRKVKRLLADEEMLLEAKDGGETVRVYGLSSADGSVLEDIVVLADGAVIGLKGKIRVDQVNELTGTAWGQ
jgi:hypothetical protein